jgi:serine phosphatase RsbU (regulator of sigma subunit)
MHNDGGKLLQQLTGELENFEDIARYLLPQPEDVPTLQGIDIYGGTLALNGVVGGDHLIYLDFKRRFDLDARIAYAAEAGRTEVVDNLRRCQTMAGIVLVDVSGHRITDALVAAMLHQAFLLGALYELDLFENLNTRFYQSSGPHKFASLIYGEISEHSMFRFLSAGQPFPVVFSKQHDRFMEVSRDLQVSFPPLGVLPSLDAIDRSRTDSLLGFKDHYQMNEWVLMGEGDILLLCTDGLVEHTREHEPYFPGRLEQKLRELNLRPAREIYEAIQQDVQSFTPPSDDISVVVIKRV